MGRRITKGRKGIPYIDRDGNKQLVFDAADTHGEERYKRLILPMKRLLDGLDVLNGTHLADDPRADYRKIHSGVASYMREMEMFGDDEKRNNLMLEGVSYSLYCRTGFPKNTGIPIHGFPYDLSGNAQLFKDIYLTAASVQEEAEEAYLRKLQEVPVIDDTDEESVSDNNPLARIETERKPTVSPLYQRYLDAQKKFPDAVVALRVGDFYEVMGDDAVKTAGWLDLTLTSREVGLPNRVPMCGFPYHVCEKYVEKILDHSSVAVVESEEDAKLILAHPEIASEQEDQEAELEEPDDPDLTDEDAPTPIKTASTRRRNKNSSQLSLFETEKSPVEELVEWALKSGSGYEHGKFRIYQTYLTDPDEHTFAEFLRKEYGIGGMSGGGYRIEYDGKGLDVERHDPEHPENDLAVSMKWIQVAVNIADLIDADQYLTEKEKEEYEQYLHDQSPAKTEETTEETLPEQEEETSNTDLTGIGFDQADLGGAKSRFYGNIAAINLVHKLFREDRNPTPDEQKTLASYVGWGGLAAAFDEHNESWQKEYATLKATLDQEEYAQAKGSVLNAHYTAQEVIDGIYKTLYHFGVRGNNRILEPACGTGNFFGYMPEEISHGAKLYGVELDSLTGKIATKLYPGANIQIKGFEQTSFTNDSFDLIVGNVPFGNYSVYDGEYAKHNFLIHDYFVAKSIDKLKTGGLMGVITSKGTMDKLNPTVRKYLADRAELVGAIRLPNNAFKQTANTEVTADILFFRKRDEQINATVEDAEWLATEKNPDGYEINSYFVHHPEMILGTLTEERGLYGAVDVTVKPDGRPLSQAFDEAISHLPGSFYTNPEESEEESNKTVEVDYDVKPLCYKVQNGKLYMRIGDEMVEQAIPTYPKDAFERISEMIDLRVALRHILEIQMDGCTDATLFEEQAKLNEQYDRFVKKHGFLNGQTNAKLFRDDGDSALLFACETLSEDKQTATKADVFTQRTIRPYASVTQTDDCLEALQISKNERGKVDIAYIEELTKKDYDTVVSELGNSVFRNPSKVDSLDKYSGFETSEEYLSGEVVRKLRTAIGAQAHYPDLGYEKNVAALQAVQPEPLTASDISVRIGASWIDTSYYIDFLCNILSIPPYYRDEISIYYNPHDSSYRVDKSSWIRGYSEILIRERYGTPRANAWRLFEDCLNLRATTIYDAVEEDGKVRRVLNQADTIAAREKQSKIKEAFKDWIFDNPMRREDLEKKYNALFNQIRLPTYDGSYLNFPEMNPAIELKPHQRNAVHRIITSGNTLLHHVVGAGKTYTMCAAIMKLRQYGLAKKPMIAVPNHLVQQWAGEFRTLYPNAKLLIASKEDLEKDNRQKFVSKVALGDWDAVIIAQSSFAKIPISSERQIRKIREEIERIEASISDQWENYERPHGAVKNLERIKKSREAQLKKLLAEDKKDNVLNFESLGVDYLFVDEAHNYKNLFLFTKMNNVAGISTSASQRATDLKLKCEYINELHGGDKGVVFATGTPISNSMTEMFTMQSYLGQDTLQQLGITYFDGWAADFGETITSLEMAPSGQGYKAKTRFAKFTNLPELLTLYRSFADVQTSDMVKLDVPDVDRQLITLKPSDTVIDLAEEIADRAEKISLGCVNPTVDNMLKITSDGKKLALDARCFDSAAPDESTSKLNACAERVFEVWQETADFNGAQIVFCDLSTPKKAFEDYTYGEDFDVYNDLKHKLVEKGIPAEEIAFIHEANSDLQKQSLFNNVNEGKVRVIMGSTEKCGAGTNVQKRLVALHHLDTPYRPSDMEQREGRIIRQGNSNDTVRIFTYVTERTFDSYSYQILENKQRFISQINTGDPTVREAEDIDETTLTYAEIKAITAANPKIKRKMEVDDRQVNVDFQVSYIVQSSHKRRARFRITGTHKKRVR